MRDTLSLHSISISPFESMVVKDIVLLHVIHFWKIGHMANCNYKHRINDIIKNDGPQWGRQLLDYHMPLHTQPLKKFMSN